MCLDDFLGKNKAPAVAINPPTTLISGAKVQTISSFLFSSFLQVSQKPNQNPSAIKGHLEPVVQHAAHLPKPQLSFKKKPDNSDSPWYPSLTHKYNAQVPLGYVYSDGDIDGNLACVAGLPLSWTGLLIYFQS